MKTLEIHLPDEVASKLERAAEEKGVPLDELVLRSVEEKRTGFRRLSTSRSEPCSPSRPEP